MNRVSIIAMAAFAAIAMPSAALAAPESPTEPVRQAEVTVEPTDELAGNYVDRDDWLVLENVDLSGSKLAYTYTVEVPECYSMHVITAFIEHENGATETIKNHVPQKAGTSEVAFTFDINDGAKLTVAIQLYTAPSYSHFNQYYNPKILEQAYKEFEASVKETSYAASNENISATLMESKASRGGWRSISAVETSNDSDKLVEYANGYVPPIQEGTTLGSFRYSISRSESDEAPEANAGFKFTVDKQYAGWSALVYIDTDHHLDHQATVHEITISDDGTFVVPYAAISEGADGQGESELYFRRLNEYVVENVTSGVVTIAVEPINIADNGAIIDFNGGAERVKASEGAEFSVASSDVSVNIASISSTKYDAPGGYERPEVGGMTLGFFSVRLYPFGDNGDAGNIVFKIDAGSQYAGRKVTIFKSRPGTLIEYPEESRKTFTLAPDGMIAITENISVNDSGTSLMLEQKSFLYAINLEPADTVSIANATVSAIPNQTWSGAAVTPKPTVTLDGKVLAEGTDYELSYENNDKPGAASVVITGKGTYSSTIRVEFQIVEKGDEPSGPSDPSGPDTPDTPDDPEKPAPTFPDVTEDAWYFEAVTRAAELGVMNGYSGSDCFGPLDWLAREQAAAVMFNYLGDNNLAAPPAPQKDVLNDWYTDAVNWAVAEGVMGGYAGTDLFGIGQTLTREEFCAVIANAAGADLDKADTSVLDRFADGSAVSAWARPAVAWAAEAGIMNGVELDNGSRALQATRGLVRAEMAAMTVSAIDAGVLS